MPNNFTIFREDLRKDKQMILFVGAGINISKFFKCKDGKIDITEDTSVYNVNNIGSMKEYWRKGENVYIVERSDKKSQE